MRNPVSKAFLATSLALAGAHSALALSVSGQIDPQTGLQSLLSWVLPLSGIAIVAISAGLGIKGVMNGEHIGRYVFGAIGGTALAFGGAPILTHYGVQ